MCVCVCIRKIEMGLEIQKLVFLFLVLFARTFTAALRNAVHRLEPINALGITLVIFTLQHSDSRARNSPRKLRIAISCLWKRSKTFERFFSNPTTIFHYPT